MRTDPRIRRTLNQFSQNLESANESAQANIFTFSQRYLGPCLASLQQCTQSCTAPCFPDREDRQWRSRGRSRGRAEFGFDFYDDWDEDDEAGDALLGWGNDEMDRLLVGSGAHGSSRDQPGRQRTMSYGTRRDRDGRAHAGRRKTGVQPHDGGPDPTVIPSTSIFGFLEHLPWNLRGKGKRYRPSAADLQDRSAVSLTEGAEGDPLLADSENEAHGAKGKHRRTRSGTNVSEITTDSLSSRGDLFPSEDEDDAVPLDDEFSMALERRTTGSEEAAERLAKFNQDHLIQSHSQVEEIEQEKLYVAAVWTRAS
ncbi:MAG: hypothetical protein M1817_003611 [Caeruleum heppii]|nr:MAG: hypothetical protein M1817_003611 [Caeruleum heppii]